MKLTYTRKNGETFEFDPDDREVCSILWDILQEDGHIQSELGVLRARIRQLCLLDKVPDDEILRLRAEIQHRLIAISHLVRDDDDKPLEDYLAPDDVERRVDGLKEENGLIRAARLNDHNESIVARLLAHQAGQFLTRLHLSEYSKGWSEWMPGKSTVFDQIEEIKCPYSLQFPSTKLFDWRWLGYFPNLKRLEIHARKRRGVFNFPRAEFSLNNLEKITANNLYPLELLGYIETINPPSLRQIDLQGEVLGTRNAAYMAREIFEAKGIRLLYSRWRDY